LAQALPTQRFYARGKTSFSYLAQHLKHKATRADRLANIDTDFEQAEDELNLAETEKIATAQPIAWIKQYFPKGTLAGNFLHEIFEQIDFQQPQMWVEEIRRRFKNTYQSLWSELLLQYQQHFLNKKIASNNCINGLLIGLVRYYTRHSIRVFS
jgi:exodeoxyribonuclease V beta subunit